MRYEAIAEHAIDKYSQYMLDEVQRAAKTLKRLHPHYIAWYECMLCHAADTYRLNKKIYNAELLIDIYPAPPILLGIY